MGEVCEAGDLLHLDPAPLGRLDALDDAGQLSALVDDDCLQPRTAPGHLGRTLLLGCRGEDGLTDGSPGRISTGLTLHLVRAVPLDNLLPIVAVKLVFQSSATGWSVSRWLEILTQNSPHSLLQSHPRSPLFF